MGLGAYDLVTRRRLHPACLAGAAWMLAMQLTGRTQVRSAAWKLVALRLIGH